MGYLHGVAHDIAGVVRANRAWMTWNLLLAVLPACLAVGLFPHRNRRSAAWWAGVAVFALLLPNAPYVVTDLIHIHPDIERATGHSVVLAGILPLYAAFILIGYLAYVACVELIVREVHTAAPGAKRWAIVGLTHIVCAVGIVLGRVARLNSWDTITSPTSTIERTFSALAWGGAPYMLGGVLVAVTLTYAVVHRLAVTVLRTMARLTRLGGLQADPA